MEDSKKSYSLNIYFVIAAVISTISDFSKLSGNYLTLIYAIFKIFDFHVVFLFRPYLLQKRLKTYFFRAIGIFKDYPYLDPF